MAPQSRAPTILLTRPEAQSDRFAAVLAQRFPGVTVLSSPLIAPQYLRPILPDQACAAVIFTSQTAVMSARRIVADGAALPRLAFCVGDQTASAATAAGFTAISAQGGGLALAHWIVAQQVTGPLLYLHGAEPRVDLATILNSAGIQTFSTVSYAQIAQSLTPAATAALQGGNPVVAPIFSARTGQILAAEYARIGGVAPLYVAGLSAEAVVAVPATALQLAMRPDSAAMLVAMAVWLT